MDSLPPEHNDSCGKSFMSEDTWGAMWEGLPLPPAAPRMPPFPLAAPLPVQSAARRSALPLVLTGEPGENGSTGAGTGEALACCGWAAQGSGPPTPAPPRLGYSPPPADSPPLPQGSAWGGEPWWKARGLALLGGTPWAPIPPQGSGIVDWETMFPPHGSPPPLSPPCPAGLHGSRLAAVRCGGLGPWYG